MTEKSGEWRDNDLVIAHISGLLTVLGPCHLSRLEFSHFPS